MRRIKVVAVKLMAAVAAAAGVFAAVCSQHVGRDRGSAAYLHLDKYNPDYRYLKSLIRKEFADFFV